VGREKEMSMDKYETEWREYLWETFEITPESKYMGLNEMETMIVLRDEARWPYKPISYQEYVESIYGKDLIPKNIRKLKI
jgi:hypothetical protein